MNLTDTIQQLFSDLQDIARLIAPGAVVIGFLVGPRVPADGVAPFELLPGQAADMTLVWLWMGERYASMGVGEYRIAIQVTR